MSFRRNLRYLIDEKAEGSDKKFAATLGWKPHTVRRLRNGSQKPRAQHWYVLLRKFGVTEETMKAPHPVFVREVISDLRLNIALATPECVKDDWLRSNRLEAQLGKTPHILYWFSSGRREVCGAEFRATGFDREGVHITFSFKRGEETRYREGRLICVGDLIYLTAWPTEGAPQLIYGILRNSLSPAEVPYQGWMLYLSTIRQQDGGTVPSIVRSRMLLSPVPSFGGGEVAEPHRRRYIRDRTGLLKRLPDEDVKKYFAEELAAR